MKVSLVVAHAILAVAFPVLAQQVERPTVDVNGAQIKKLTTPRTSHIHADDGTASASNDGPPGSPTLDLSGTPIPGGGNATYQMYTTTFQANGPNTAITFAFREDPAFLYFSNPSVTDTTINSGNLLTDSTFAGGVYTSNGNAATPVGWTYANVYGATYGGVVVAGCGASPTGTLGVGNCWYDGAVQAYDALTQTIATTSGHQYQITYWLADNSACSVDGGPPCNFSNLSMNGDTTDTGGNGIDVTVYNGAALPAPDAIHFELRRNDVSPNQGMLALATAQDASNNPVDLQDAAQKVGFAHFNWLQMIVSNLLLEVCSTNSSLPDCASPPIIGGAVASVPTPDPPFGGWAYEYWDTYCPDNTCPFLTPVQDYWNMYWDEFFAPGPASIDGTAPYLPSPTHPEYREMYQSSNTLSNRGITDLDPSTAKGFYYGDRPGTSYIVPVANSVQNDSFVTMLVGVTGTCDVVIVSDCGFQIIPGTIFQWNSTNGSITFTPTPGQSPLVVAHETGTSTPMYESSTNTAQASNVALRDGKNPDLTPLIQSLCQDRIWPTRLFLLISFML